MKASVPGLVINVHQGLGDHIECQGIVRHYAETYDSVYLLCTKPHNLEAVRFMYRDHFSHVEGVHVQEFEAGTSPSNWMMGVRIEGNQSYECIKDFLYKKGVDSRPMFYPMSKHNHLKKFSTDNEAVASKLTKECVLLPSYPGLTESQCMTVIEAVKEYTR